MLIGRSLGGASVKSFSGTVSGRLDFRRHGLIALGILTCVRDVLTPDDLLAKILGPCVAWVIVFGVSWLSIILRRPSDIATELRTGPPIDCRDATLISCLLITQLCAASSNRFGGSVLPHVRSVHFSKAKVQILLPIIVTIQEHPGDEEFGGRQTNLTFAATFFAILPAFMMYPPSIPTVLLAITSAYTFVKAMTCWQNFEDSRDQLADASDEAPVKLLCLTQLRPVTEKSPMSRIRMIALLLTFALGSFLVLYRYLFFAVPRTYWKYAVGVAPIESARVLLIFALVFHPSRGIINGSSTTANVRCRQWESV